MKKTLKIALIGNPNTGKSTLFNALTGLNQKVGNFPGVTVEKKSGTCKLSDEITAEIIDLPGSYSLYPRSKDEYITLELLSSRELFSPDLIVMVADASNLKRNLLLFSQLSELDIPIVLVLNMIDAAERNGISIDIPLLTEKLGVPVVPMNAREQLGIAELKEVLARPVPVTKATDRVNVNDFVPDGLISEIKERFHITNDYAAYQLAHHYKAFKHLKSAEKASVEEVLKKYQFNSSAVQATETIARYNDINELLFDTVKRIKTGTSESYSNRIDKVLTHRIFGLLIFFFILFVVFQSIFTWSEYPMDLIDQAFSYLSILIKQHMPSGVLTELFADGILPGLSGVFMFIPQIAILFAFIALLEDTGYMARVTFMMDRLMRKAGLNGKSIVPLISGVACAVPAVMAARNIENWKERLITIMVTPLMSCSARLPVYTLLIGLVVPDRTVLGFFNLQGLVLMFMYLLGFMAAIGAAIVFKYLIRSAQKGYFLMELPVYRMPRWPNVFLTLYDRSKTFVLEAGKVIVAVSVILWVLASYGPSDSFSKIEERHSINPTEQSEQLIQAEKLEASYAGRLGKFIEPAIRPLGFDWKIGIAIITSFAAREVFVGTMATIYSVNNEAQDISTVREKLKEARRPDGEPVFTTATAFSLMIFFAFAMQCMSTFAVVYRETKSWKWPTLQLIYMTGAAYLASLLTYHLLT